MSKKVLIVEDEEMIVRVLAIRLEGLGYKVLTAPDGDKGLALARKEKPDLLILDIGLPNIDGNTLCELVKSDPATKGVRVIILTGQKLVGEMERSFSAGADVYVNKPYDWQRLSAHVRELIGDPG